MELSVAEKLMFNAWARGGDDDDSNLNRWG